MKASHFGLSVFLIYAACSHALDCPKHLVSSEDREPSPALDGLQIQESELAASSGLQDLTFGTMAGAPIAALRFRYSDTVHILLMESVGSNPTRWAVSKSQGVSFSEFGSVAYSRLHGSQLVVVYKVKWDPTRVFLCTLDLNNGGRKTLKELTLPSDWTLGAVAVSEDKRWVALGNISSVTGAAARFFDQNPRYVGPNLLFDAQSETLQPLELRHPTARAIEEFVFSPDGKTLVGFEHEGETVCNEGACEPSDPGHLISWDTSTLKLARQMATPTHLENLTFSPNGLWLAAGDLKDPVLRVWNRELTHVYPVRIDLEERVSSVLGSYPNLAYPIFSADGNKLWAFYAYSSLIINHQGEPNKLSDGLPGLGRTENTLLAWDFPSFVSGNTAPRQAIELEPGLIHGPAVAPTGQLLIGRGIEGNLDLTVEALSKKTP